MGGVDRCEMKFGLTHVVGGFLKMSLTWTKFLDPDNPSRFPTRAHGSGLCMARLDGSAVMMEQEKG